MTVNVSQDDLLIVPRARDAKPAMEAVIAHLSQKPNPTPSSLTAGAAMMTAEANSDVPDRDSPDYVSYLADKIEEEKERLKSLQDKCRVAAMEVQLSQLRINM